MADFLAAFFFPPFFFAAIVVLSMTGVNRPFDPPVDRRAGQPDSEEHWAPLSTRYLPRVSRSTRVAAPKRPRARHLADD